MEKDPAIVECMGHLHAIGEALNSFQRDHRELPLQLSDLFPRYIADEQIFFCPADRNQTQDPGGSPMTSYSYEGTLDETPDGGLQLGPSNLGPNPTLRECKLVQRLYFGDRVPIVRCPHHAETFLDLSLGGRIFFSQWPVWENQDDTAPFVLGQIEEALSLGAAYLARNWSIEALERYTSRSWIDSPLEPGLRFRLGRIAERMIRVIEHVPCEYAARLSLIATRFLRAAGRDREAIDCVKHSLRLNLPTHDVEILDDTLVLLDYLSGGKKDCVPIDSYIRTEMALQHIPGLVIGVVKDGKLIVSKGYGFANIEQSIPMSSTTILPIMSMTKTFTAAAIVKLIEQGKLYLGDPIARYIDDAPGHWSQVTIQHLLSHTSGIPGIWSGDIDTNQYPEPVPLTVDEIIRYVSPMPLKFSPGERWSYSNTGYMILGRILERITDKPFAEVVEENIFTPLQVRVKPSQVVDLEAVGYRWKDGSHTPVLQLDEEYRKGSSLGVSWNTGSGGFISTIEDLFRWDRALYPGRLLKGESLDLMFKPATLRNEKEAVSGLCWWISSSRGHRVVFHSGNMPGFTSLLVRIPEEDYAVILLINLDVANRESIAEGIGRLYRPEPTPIADPLPEMTRRHREVLNRFISGIVRSEDFTREAYDRFWSDNGEAQKFYASLGDLKSFRRIARTDAPGCPATYCADFSRTSWVIIVTTETDGTIDRWQLESL